MLLLRKKSVNATPNGLQKYTTTKINLLIIFTAKKLLGQAQSYLLPLHSQKIGIITLVPS